MFPFCIASSSRLTLVLHNLFLLIFKLPHLITWFSHSIVSSSSTLHTIFVLFSSKFNQSMGSLKLHPLYLQSTLPPPQFYFSPLYLVSYPTTGFKLDFIYSNTLRDISSYQVPNITSLISFPSKLLFLNISILVLWCIFVFLLFLKFAHLGYMK